MPSLVIQACEHKQTNTDNLGFRFIEGINGDELHFCYINTFV